MSGPSAPYDQEELYSATYAGGKPGFVTGAKKWMAYVGKGVTDFIWPWLRILDNWADAGENVADYTIANAWGTGPTWARCTEANDKGGKATGLWGHEYDIKANGTDPAQVRGRFGNAVLIGKCDPAGLMPLGYAAWIAGTLHGDPNNGLWQNGFMAEHARDRCFTSGPNCTADVFLAPQGKHVVGLDCTQGDILQPIRIKAGQRITLEETGQIAIRFNPVAGAIEFLNGPIVAHSIKVVG